MVGFEQHTPPHGFQMYGGAEDLFHSSSAPAAAAAAAAAATTTLGAEDTQHHTQALLYHLEVLKEKVQQVQSLVSLFLVAPNPMQVPHSESLTMVASTPNLIQDIIAAASSMLYAFQQLADGDGTHFPPTPVPGSNSFMRSPPPAQPSIAHEVFDHVFRDLDDGDEMKRGGEVLGGEPTLYGSSNGNGAGANAGGDEIIEVDASDLLAKYTHYCQVCGKGFKRDANLRMHMRAHGDEYKTNAALASPSMGLKEVASPAGRINIKYSCPHEGCRWNRKHAKFQPLKSMVCVKNHYKRSHCPKMYVCNRCHYKQFAVLSDLRTHEKHCGDLKWMCSCGTNFSRKDKLMGHVALFVGHAPVVNCLTK